MISNKNKSNDGTLHKCDFCGCEPEELWMGFDIDGQYCFNHFRETHEDVVAFDKWCKEFCVEKTNNRIS